MLKSTNLNLKIKDQLKSGNEKGLQAMLNVPVEANNLRSMCTCAHITHGKFKAHIGICKMFPVPT